MKDRRKQRIGKVISDKMDRTVVVQVEWSLMHPIYRKPQRRVSKFYADNPESKAHLGDVVRIEETRPISKLKRWRVLEVMGHRDVVQGEGARGTAVPTPEAVLVPAAEGAKPDQNGESA